MTRALTRLVGFLIILASFSGAWALMEWRQFTAQPLTVPIDREPVVTIESGTSVKQLAVQLAREGYISHPRFFEWLVRFRRSERSIQAGEFRVDADMTPEMFIERVVTGEVVQYAFTIVEGWTFAQFVDALSVDPKVRQTLTDLSPQTVMAALGYAGEHPEGRFLPDTYFFPAGTTDVEFLKRAYDAMSAYLETAWVNRDSGVPLKTPYEALILASIVERETAVPAERAQIAGVFTRRLKKGMRLQTDPTVIYGLGDRFDGNIRRQDLLTDTPYNTYTRRGLPPTPIALPSAAAIDAALHPAGGDALYFVARGDGSHHFSTTLEEHNRAVREYQILAPRRQRASQP